MKVVFTILTVVVVVFGSDDAKMVRFYVCRAMYSFFMWGVCVGVGVCVCVKNYHHLFADRIILVGNIKGVLYCSGVVRGLSPGQDKVALLPPKTDAFNAVGVINKLVPPLTSPTAEPLKWKVIFSQGA